jgi:hypothetical protein
MNSRSAITLIGLFAIALATACSPPDLARARLLQYQENDNEDLRSWVACRTPDQLQEALKSDAVPDLNFDQKHCRVLMGNRIRDVRFISNGMASFELYAQIFRGTESDGTWYTWKDRIQQ